MSKYVKSASVKQAHLISACCSCQDGVPKTAESRHHVIKGIFWLWSYFLCAILRAPFTKDDKIQYTCA